MLMFILGILCWMLVCTIVTLCADNEEVTTQVSVGIFGVILHIVAGIVGRTLLLYCRRFNCYAFYGKYGHYCNYYMTAKMAKQFRMLDDISPSEDPSYSIRLLRSGKTFKSTVHRQDIITNINKVPDNMTADMWEKFKKKAPAS